VRNVLRTVSDYEACNEALRRICGAYQIAHERWWEFAGRIGTLKAGSLEFADVVFSSGQVLRDRDDRHYRGDHCFLILQAAGSARMRQGGSEAALQPGDCTLIDSRYPSVFEIGPGFHQYSFHLPVPLVAERFGTRNLPLAPHIRSDRGAGALLSQLLAAAVRNAPTLDGIELTGATLDLLAAALGVKAGCGAPIQAERRPLGLREITQFVDAHIQSASLSPAAIAAHFNTSVRRLYRLVGAAGWTPASLIWSRRLERARELLAQGECRAPIIDVALTCGFKDGAHFSRAFRKAFGHPPKVARSLTAGSCDGTDGDRTSARSQREALPEPSCVADAAAPTPAWGRESLAPSDSAWRTRSTEAGTKSATRCTNRVQTRA